MPAGRCALLPYRWQEGSRTWQNLALPRAGESRLRSEVLRVNVKRQAMPLEASERALHPECPADSGDQIKSQWV